jgi:hypothetical protein
VTALVPLAAVLLTIVLIGATLLVGQRLALRMRWTRPLALPEDPVPDGWADLVRERFPLAGDLAPEDFERLLELVQLFLRTKHIEGASGLEVTDEIRVTIAAQACFLVLWLDVGLYPALKTVIVYPSTMVPRYTGERWRYGEMQGEEEQPILGQSWTQGVVILAWDNVRHGALDPRDGQNLVFHEFAHQLDQEVGGADGVPVGLPLSALKPWAEVIERRFRQLAKAERTGRRSVLDAYGATNQAEFFAVATEAFFEKPHALRAKKPDLYALLVELYRVDPAGGGLARRVE